jgi:hypothetical protein
MNLIWSVMGAIFFGFLAGASGSFFLWYVYGRYSEWKLKKSVIKSDVINQLDNTKPVIDERGHEEDERKRIEKIRQFEKLRRLGIGEQTITKPVSFYTRKFEDGKGGGFSSSVINNAKQDSRSTGSPKSEDRRTIKFD